MSLTWGEIKRLIRLQAVAEQLADIVRQGQDPDMSRDSGRRLLDELITEAHDVLKNADAGLAEEFERIVTERRGTRVSLAVQASMVAGWLNGTVEAETLEVRIRMGDGGRRPGRLASTRENGG